MRITIEIAVQVYDKIGHKQLGKSSDDTMMQWGASELTITNTKVETINKLLKTHEKGIEAYKLLNKALGGRNSI